MKHKYFVTSDVHSCYTGLQDALSKAGWDINNPDHVLIICGDAFDRLNETVKVFEFIKDLQSKNRILYVKGNHESLLFDCVEEISKGYTPSRHHFSNGTVKTICQFCGESEWIIYDPSWRNKICETMQPVLDFINKHCVNYAEIGDYVFVHSGIPFSYEGDNPWFYKKVYNPNWRDASDFSWEEAMWGNPFEMAEKGFLPKDKVLVFGHWHTSYAWSKKEGVGEFGEGAKFDIFYGDGYIGLDGCTAHTKKVNILIIEDGKILNEEYNA